MDAVRPLIVPSFEKTTSSILREDFSSLYGKHDFHPIVGVPAIQYYTDRGQTSNKGKKSKQAELPVDPEDCYIQIPSIHPRSDRFDNGPAEPRRVFDMTMWQVVLMMECALDILKEGFIGPRSQLCTRILGSFHERWSRSGNELAFARAKDDLVQWYVKKGESRYSKDPVRTFKAT